MRVAILTGASGGMGFAVARRLGQEGYTLIVNSRDPSQAVKRLEAEGWKVVGVPGDLTEAATAGDLVGMAERMGRLDALFLNYGGPPAKPVLEVMEEGWRRYFELINRSFAAFGALVSAFGWGQGGGGIGGIVFRRRDPSTGRPMLRLWKKAWTFPALGAISAAARSPGGKARGTSTTTPSRGTRGSSWSAPGVLGRRETSFPPTCALPAPPGVGWPTSLPAAGSRRDP